MEGNSSGNNTEPGHRLVANIAEGRGDANSRDFLPGLSPHTAVSPQGCSMVLLLLGASACLSSILFGEAHFQS